MYKETSQLYLFHHIENLLAYLETWDSPSLDNIYPKWLWEHINTEAMVNPDQRDLNLIRFLVITRQPTFFRKVLNGFLPKSLKSKANIIGILRNSKEIKIRMDHNGLSATKEISK